MEMIKGLASGKGDLFAGDAIPQAQVAIATVLPISSAKVRKGRHPT
jgi:hypothetical protein